MSSLRFRRFFCLGNKIKDFILLGKTKIFSLAWENKKSNFFSCGIKVIDFILLGKTKQYFLCLGKQKKYFFSCGNKVIDFYFLGKQNINILLKHVLNEPP